MKMLKSLLVLSCVCGVTQVYSQLQTVTATPANDFLNSIGVNSSINSRGEKTDTTLKTCQYIGARWIRSGPPDSGEHYWKQTTIDCYKRLWQQGGIKFSLMLPSSGDAYSEYDDVNKVTVYYKDGITRVKEAAHQFINEMSPDALIAFEGVNEPNNWAITYKGVQSGGSNSWRGIARYHRDFYDSIQVDPVLRNYPVWALSETGAERDNMGLQYLTVPETDTNVDIEFRGVTYANYANCHNYFVHPSWAIHNNNQTWLAADPTKNAKADHLYGNFGKTWSKGFYGISETDLLTVPRVTTETGVTIGGDVTEEDQALCYLSCYLAQFKQGWKYTAMYILRDRIDEGGNQTFGFFESHWVNEQIRYPSNPRLSAHYMHNMTTILADNQSIETPSSLAYEITPCPATVHDLLLQKNNGKLMLVIWGEKYAVGATADNVAVNFGVTMQNVKVYNPAQYDASQPNKGTLPIREENNVSSISLSMLNHPWILELTPQTTSIEQFADDKVTSTQYYNLQGQPIGKTQPNNLYIVKETRQSAKTTARIVIINQ